MKKLLCFLLTLLAVGGFAYFQPSTTAKAESTKAKMVIVIDDFGSYDQSGVETMLSIDAPLTCAVMPFVDNTHQNAKQVQESGKELIVHMPMESHVSLPLSWYGKTYISTYESKENVYKKLNDAFADVEGAKGFNVHIGSGVCQNENVARYIYSFAKEKNLPFLDSRTHLNTKFDKVAKEMGEVYLGRSEFLEPDHNRSYEGVKHHLLVGANMAKENGYSIVIGHVGVHGGENTARAIKDSIQTIRDMGIEIVTLSDLYSSLKK